MEVTEYSEQIRILERELPELKRQLREEKKAEARKHSRPRGREPLDNKLIEKAKE